MDATGKISLCFDTGQYVGEERNGLQVSYIASGKTGECTCTMNSGMKGIGNVQLSWQRG